MNKPRIGITADLAPDSKGRLWHQVRATYVDAVIEAGGIPLVLPAVASMREALADSVDGVLMTGGDDIDTREFGIATHPAAKCMHPERQRAEFALLKALEQRPDKPVLGICLGMQLMGVHGGCNLMQHMHDHIADADRHGGDNPHAVESEFGTGQVASSHHQALTNPGKFQVVGTSDDGVIEAIRDSQRPFYVGVQWHPERTKDSTLGLGVIKKLVEASRRM